MHKTSPPAFFRRKLGKELCVAHAALGRRPLVWVDDFSARCGLFSKGLKNFTSRFGPLDGSWARVRVFLPSCSMRLSALAAGKKAARLGCNPRPCRRQEGGLSSPATGRPVPCGHAPPFGGPGGRAPFRRVGRGHSPLPGGAGEASPAMSLKSGQLFPADRRAENVVFHARWHVSAQVQKRNPRPCGTQEGGLSSPATGRSRAGHGPVRRPSGSRVPRR